MRPAAHTCSEWVPDEPVSNAKHRFCSCGAHGSYTRIWDDSDIDRDRFKELLKNVIMTLLSFHVISSERHARSIVKTAVFHRNHGDSVNDAIAAGVASIDAPEQPEAIST